MEKQYQQLMSTLRGKLHEISRNMLTDADYDELNIYKNFINLNATSINIGIGMNKMVFI